MNAEDTKTCPGATPITPIFRWAGSKRKVLPVAVNHDSPKKTFAENLRRASENGIGVIQFDKDGRATELRQPVPLSLYALRKTDLTMVPKNRKEALKSADATFLNGNPPQGCHEICQELEDVTRKFAEFGSKNGLWKSPAGSTTWPDKFFRVDSWALMLDELDQRIDVQTVRKVVPGFSKASVAAVRAHTDWRNVLSHKPKNAAELKKRDQMLRTMFEATRDILVQWYGIAVPFKLIQ